MDFFEAQARAKKQTTRLVGLFALAVAGTIAAGYFAAVLVLGQATGGPGRSGPAGEPSLWQPELLATVTASLAAGLPRRAITPSVASLP